MIRMAFLTGKSGMMKNVKDILARMKAAEEEIKNEPVPQPVMEYMVASDELIRHLQNYIDYLLTKNND